MKHKKLSISVVSAFIAALGLTSCSNNVTASENAIVTLKGYDGQEIAIDTNAIYDKYKVCKFVIKDNSMQDLAKNV